MLVAAPGPALCRWMECPVRSRDHACSGTWFARPSLPACVPSTAKPTTYGAIELTGEDARLVARCCGVCAPRDSVLRADAKRSTGGKAEDSRAAQKICRGHPVLLRLPPPWHMGPTIAMMGCVAQRCHLLLKQHAIVRWVCTDCYTDCCTDCCTPCCSPTVD